ncbi:hypothetical protein QFC19_003347 [Naganishia cerealis]|uniref:Uncharacterized protein n=1 Tax=Naganishia cerealis TaxID=610337 RepID=A0ACC2W3P0_9TREE|nr:hypothetical protein QFC19_003347 [Naganishia cerealis]
MKIWNEEQEQGAWHANLRGGVKGATIAATIAGSGWFALNRTYPKFRALPVTLKGAMCVTIAAPLIVFFAEDAGVQYQKTLWNDAGKTVLEEERREERQRWEALSTGEKAKQWAKENQWRLIGGGWVGSMAVAGGMLARNPYMSFSQKLVQARVVAQASTLVTLIAFGVLAGTHQAQSDNGKPQEVEDHSWKRILGSDMSSFFMGGVKLFHAYTTINVPLL